MHPHTYTYTSTYMRGAIAAVLELSACGWVQENIERLLTVFDGENIPGLTPYMYASTYYTYTSTYIRGALAVVLELSACG